MTTSTTRLRFTAPEAWSGEGNHTLSLRYPGTSTERLQAARDALWTFPGLEGCWRRNDREPSAASRITCTWGLALGKPLFGIAHLPGTEGVACGALAHAPRPAHELHCPVCEAMGLPPEEPEGWLDLHLPLGGLALAFPIGRYPVADGTSLAWRDLVDEWLRALAAHVHRVAPFDLGILGWPCGLPHPLPRRPEEIPEDRTVGYLLPAPDGLAWFPPDREAPVPAELAENGLYD